MPAISLGFSHAFQKGFLLWRPVQHCRGAWDSASLSGNNLILFFIPVFLFCYKKMDVGDVPSYDDCCVELVDLFLEVAFLLYKFFSICILSNVTGNNIFYAFFLEPLCHCLFVTCVAMICIDNIVATKSNCYDTLLRWDESNLKNC